ncbi:site-specific integrase [Klebsiella pneumoniae]|nr:site-specific integrase [Klebsiella pneumoniae]
MGCSSRKSKTNKSIDLHFSPAADDLLKKAMTYGDILFPGEDLKNPITISGANKFLRRIKKDSLGFGEFTSHDFSFCQRPTIRRGGCPRTSSKKCWGHELGGVLSVYITSMTGFSEQKTPMICMLKRMLRASGDFWLTHPV